MSEGTDGGLPNRRKRHAGGELIIPVAGLVFTIYYFSTILDSPWTAQVSAFFVGAILIALIVALLVKTLLDYRGGLVSLSPGPLADPRQLLPKRLALFALTIGYIFVIHLLGFTLTTFLFLAASMTLLSDGRRFGFIAALSAVIAIAGWVLFVLAFKTRFPTGPFETLMDALF